jgi:hypothetical protein
MRRRWRTNTLLLGDNTGGGAVRLRKSWNVCTLKKVKMSHICHEGAEEGEQRYTSTHS